MRARSPARRRLASTCPDRRRPASPAARRSPPRRPCASRRIRTPAPASARCRNAALVRVRTPALEQHRFVGLESAGRELAQDLLAGPGHLARRVEVLDPDDPRAASRARVEPARERRDEGARVQRAGGRGGEPAPVGHRSGSEVDVATSREHARSRRALRVARGCDYPGRRAAPARRGVFRRPVIAARIRRQLRCALDVKAQAVSPTTRCASEAPTDTPRWSRAEPFPLREERRRDPSRRSRSISAPRSPSSAACCRRCCCSRS